MLVVGSWSEGRVEAPDVKIVNPLRKVPVPSHCHFYTGANSMRHHRIAMKGNAAGPILSVNCKWTKRELC